MGYDFAREQADLAANVMARLIEQLARSGAITGADCVQLAGYGSLRAEIAPDGPARRFFNHWTSHVLESAYSAKDRSMPRPE
ncbi:hypothetical protein [Sphingomonas gellani]|uniref:hypothetical protein n=1 Tax=Sphingomonas gellani TaxID=1166340 RepID=UPI001113A784|nr:hypothetical protein [Sphingomonas gellani]